MGKTPRNSVLIIAVKNYRPVSLLVGKQGLWVILSSSGREQAYLRWGEGRVKGIVSGQSRITVTKGQAAREPRVSRLRVLCSEDLDSCQDRVKQLHIIDR